MNKKTRTILIAGIIEAVIILATSLGLPGFCFSSTPSNNAAVEAPVDQLKQNAYYILDTKCNVCHRKQNPFKVFSLKNMEKHAAKIYRQVFIEQRMPKGDEIELTLEEQHTLKNWLLTQDIF